MNNSDDAGFGTIKQTIFFPFDTRSLEDKTTNSPMNLVDGVDDNNFLCTEKNILFD